MSSNKYPIRRDALISPWGVGAIIPFPNDESLMVARLDDWFINDQKIDDYKIVDERLEKRLGGKMLVMPPDYREKSLERTYDYMKIPAVRFPLWHYCPVCGNMERLGSNSQKKTCSGEIRRTNSKETNCSKRVAANKKASLLIPERFIAVCSNGHIEDFPIMEWVHVKSNKLIYPTCKLNRSTGGKTASLAGVRYTCTCGASATMNGAFGWDGLKSIGYKCTGNQPWLGIDANIPCGRDLLVLQRGASNVWFADIISSVYIPNANQLINESTKDCVNKGVKRFSSSRQDGLIDINVIERFVSQIKLIDDDIDVELACKEIIEKLGGDEKINLPATDLDYRKQEYDVLIRSIGKPEDELFTKNHSAMSYSNIDFLKSITLVHKLRETRVFTGFRRISPEESTPAPISNKNIGWLPAIKNSGEGIMFEFDSLKLDTWARKEKVISRVKIIENNMKATGKFTNEKLNPIYILLHTFSHCLITALSTESGYSNASIRERIYCDKFLLQNSHPMKGILIYTASGDSEGSLGGLVRQGASGRIERVIKRAINDAQWCAADPVCIQSAGQGQYGSNLAACHNCSLLPETSCEDKNMFLDRGLLIGTLEEDGASIGFFSDHYEKD